MKRTYHYRIVTNFSPEELFACLREATKPPVEFDFEWMKRRIALRSRNTDALEKTADCLDAMVEKKGGQGLLLRGDTIRKQSGEREIPFGVLLQTPDVYTDMIIAALKDMSIPVHSVDEDGCGFRLLGGRLSNLLHLDEFLAAFPLPSYLRIISDRTEAPGA